MAAANKPLKILACGDVAGKYDKLLKRIAVVNKKAGPFEMLLCVGRFLGTNGREDLRMLRARVYDFPVSTYVLAPVDDEELGPAGEEICPNLINLGSMGLYKTGSGLTIAYCGRVVNEAEVKAFVTNVSETDAVGVDVLLTCLWPENVMEFSSDPDKHNRLDTRLCSRVVSVAARSLRPRYHFAGMQRMYYERLPYRNHRVLVDAESHVTRFFGLADCGNAGEKWLYAFNVVPMRLMSRAELRAQPPVCCRPSRS